MDENMLLSFAPNSIKNLKTIAQIFDLTGKVAIVTGGASGLGYNVVNRLAEAGAKVVIVGRNKKKNEKAVGEFAALGYDVSSFSGDVSSVADCYASVDYAVEKYGSVDILVTCAAVFSRRSFIDVDEELYDQTLGVCTKGEFFMAQAAARQMIRQGRGGKIVLVTSLAYKVLGMPKMAMQPHYDTAKGAIISMTKTIAQNLGQYGIQVNCISPGAMMTSGAATSNDGGLYGEEFVKKSMAVRELNIGAPFTRNPDEVALMAFVLCTHCSDFMQGTIVDVDGGADLSFQEDPWSYTLEGCIPGPKV